MQYAGWLVGYTNSPTGDRHWEGPFITSTEAKKFAEEVKPHYKFVNIYHLVNEFYLNH